ncbi:HAD family hydrolase [Catellatospora citrea]|uniref:Hydrolase n=1 Tax=Catellatospora citrea TaxID=53366 RepID=A0A8J3KGQ8_9ACTN|nr:HAD family hydrolase [Catellatospora citrea]RKE11153.1 phosphoglycolate phosphatase [Catellatospora citrea]GIF96618.1 hydrolase [Catellatospora citrea]
MTTAILFDVDGTLVDTPAAMTTVLRTVVAEHGRTAADDRLRATVGRPLAASLAGLLELPTDHPAVVQAADRARELFTQTVIPSAPRLVFPGVPELLAALRERGHPLAVVTSKVRPSAIELLDAAGLLDAFDTLACHGMTERGKPYPDLALLAAAALDTPPADCVVVGDAVDDVRMANAAGMRPIGVSTGVATRAELVLAGARAVYAGPAALGPALLDEPTVRPFDLTPR